MCIITVLYTGFACKDDNPVISGGVRARVTFLPPEGPALTSYASCLVVYWVRRFNSWILPDGHISGSLPRVAELVSQAPEADLQK